METRIANQLNQLGDSRYHAIGVGERVHNSTTDAINIQAYQFAAQNGWTLTQHSLTPAEIAFHLGAYQQAAQFGPIDKLRWSLCHVDPITDAQIAQVKALGIGLNIQGYGYIRASRSELWAAVPKPRRVRDPTRRGHRRDRRGADEPVADDVLHDDRQEQRRAVVGHAGTADLSSAGPTDVYER